MPAPPPRGSPELAGPLPILPPSPPPSTPPSPDDLLPEAARVVGALRDRFRGHLAPAPAPIEHFTLPRDQLSGLVRCIRADSSLAGFFDDKIRFDYDAPAQELVLRMPTALHECFCHGVAAHITDQLKSLGRSVPRLGSLLDDIHSAGSATLELFTNDESDTPTQRSPDYQFQHQDADWPSVVIEVSYSQPLKKLAPLAFDYLRGSDGQIRVVLGFDLAYGTEDREATVIMWREQAVVGNDGEEYSDVVPVHREVFRDSAGNARPGSLELDLADFVTSDSLEDNDEDHHLSVCISHGFLCAQLTTAEKAMERSQRRPRRRQHGNSARRWVKRKWSSSPDELSDGAEHKYQRLEQRDVEQASRHDAEFAAATAGTAATRPLLPVRRSTRIASRSEG